MAKSGRKLGAEGRLSATDSPAARSGRLHRELGVLEAAALSIAVMAPTAAMALNGSLSASYAGPATTLAFLLAFVTILLVSPAVHHRRRRSHRAGDRLPAHLLD
jgi:hypothetical protein